MSELSTAATNILNRLAAAPTYHPGNADLFTDWNLQAGDVVTVAADGENYSVPIYNMKLKWTGQSKVEVESTGNPKREPPPAVNRKSYGSAAGGYGGQKQLSDTLHAAGLFVDPETGVWAYASEQGEDYALGATFSVQSTAINLKVSKGSVSTQLAVECGNVHVSGGNLTVDGYILANELESAIATIEQVQMLDMYAGTGTIENFTAGDIRVNDTASFGTVTVNGTDLESNAVSSIGPATVDPQTGGVSIPWSFLNGNPGQPITFSIASTVYFQQAVAAAQSAGWTQGYSDGVDAATPTSISASSASAPTHISSGWTSTTTLTPYVDETAGTPFSGTINVDAPYSAGVTAGASSVTLSEGWNSEATYSVTASNGRSHSTTLTGLTLNRTYTNTDNNHLMGVFGIYADSTQVTTKTIDINSVVTGVTASRVQNNSSRINIYNDSQGNLSVSVYVRLSNGNSGTYTISVPYMCID